MEEKSKLQLIGEIAQADNKNLELIEEINEKEEEIERLKELIKTLYFREDKYTFKEFTEEQLELLNNILYGSEKNE